MKKSKALDKYPEWWSIRDSRFPYDVVYVRDINGSAPFCIVVRSSDSSLSADVGFRTVVWGPFAEAAREKEECARLVSQLQAWWQEYQKAHGAADGPG